MNAKEAAKRLGITRQQMTRYVRAGKLRVYGRYKNAYVFHIRDVKRLVKRRQAKRDLLDAYILEGGSCKYNWYRRHKMMFLHPPEYVVESYSVPPVCGYCHAPHETGECLPMDERREG